jgi:hypothetical protein
MDWIPDFLAFIFLIGGGLAFIFNVLYGGKGGKKTSEIEKALQKYNEAKSDIVMDTEKKIDEIRKKKSNDLADTANDELDKFRRSRGEDN